MIRRIGLVLLALALLLAAAVVWLNSRGEDPIPAGAAPTQGKIGRAHV